MRKYLDIHLKDRKIESCELTGREHAEAGRYFIAKTLLDMGVAKVDPLGPENPLIFSAGPFSGTNFSNANRTSVGCKSPLTGGIKEANSGGTSLWRSANRKSRALHCTASPTIGSLSTCLKRVKSASTTRRLTWDEATSKRPPCCMRHTAKRPVSPSAPRWVSIRVCSQVSRSATRKIARFESLLAAVSALSWATRKSKPSSSIKAKCRRYTTAKGNDHHQGVWRQIKRAGAGQEFPKSTAALVANLTNNLGALPVRNFSSGRMTEPGELLEVAGSTSPRTKPRR